MISEHQIPEPVLFNPLKHHLGYIKDFANREFNGGKYSESDILKQMKHIGNSVMDVYSGVLAVKNLCSEVLYFLKKNKLSDKDHFSEWAGMKADDYKLISLSDGSEWMIKYNDNISRYVHVFPSRGDSYSFRVKSNTLKTALLYHIKIGKDYITGDDLNRVRPLLGLSPVKNSANAEAIIEMIEIIRNQ